MVINYTPIIPLEPFRRALKWVALSTLAAILLAAAAPILWGQQPPPGFQPGVPAPLPGQAPGPAAPGQIINITEDLELRFHLVLLDRMSYQLHPFYQITGDQAYLEGKGASGFITSIGERDSDEGASFATRLIHSLPPFGVEGVRDLNFPFPRGIGFGFDFNVFSQRDTEAARGEGTVTAIQSDTFIYSGVLRLYFFSPNQPGINYFVGASLGLLEGKMRVPFATGAVEFISYRQSPVGSTKLGLESRGDDWGFRYELSFFNAETVELKSNPYPNAINSPTTTIDFSGTVIRVSIFAQF